MKEMFLSFDEIEELQEKYTLENNGSSGKYFGYSWYTATNDEDPDDIIEVYTRPEE